MLHDRYDLPISTDSPEARDAYVDGVDRLLAADGAADASLARALDCDPDLALAHAARARWLQLSGRAAEAQEAAARAVELAETAGSPRERRHAAIFARLAAGRGAEALALVREHVAETPRDALALSPACGVFGLIGFSGRLRREPEQVEILEPLVGAYGDDWWFCTAYAFALVEVGRWEEGRRLVERALEQHPRNAHGAHVLAHALYEGGEDGTASAFLEGWLPSYPADGQLHCHLWWHACLLRLMLGEVDAMREIYDRECAPAVSASPAINVASDGVSLLWRSELAGEPREEARWQALRGFIAERFPEPMVFVDVHAALALAIGGDRTAFEEYLGKLEAMGRDARLPAGQVPAQLARAFDAFANSRWSQAIADLEAASPSVVRIGGSRAQRDLVRNTLLAAYVQDGRSEEARRMAAAQHDRNPTTPVSGLR